MKIYYNVDGGWAFNEIAEPVESIVLNSEQTFLDPPEEKEGMYLNIVNNEWEYFEIPPVDFDILKMDMLSRYQAWEGPYVERHFIFAGDVYPNDSRFKEMMNSAMGALSAWKRLPKLWISATRRVITPVSEGFLNALGETAYIEQENSISTAVQLLARIQTATTVEELEAIEFPVILTIDELAELIRKTHEEAVEKDMVEEEEEVIEEEIEEDLVEE